MASVAKRTGNQKKLDYLSHVSDGLCGPSELSSVHFERSTKAAIPSVHDTNLQRIVSDTLSQKMRSLEQEYRETYRKSLRLNVIVDIVLSFLPSTYNFARTGAGGVVHAATGSANLDFFFQNHRQSLQVPNEQMERLLENAWAEHPESCLRIIFHIGASRIGKKDRYVFYDAAMWLWRRQPAALLTNLERIPSLIYWKALLELVVRVLEGPEATRARDRALNYKKLLGGNLVTADDSKQKWGDAGSRLSQAKLALKRYYEDPLYRALHQRVAALFSAQLEKDLEDHKKGWRPSLCAKWAPIPGSSIDRRTLLCESIARGIFKRSLDEYADLDERHYAFRVRDRLRKQVLTPLKESRKEPAVLMSQRRWGEVDYKSVPQNCMSLCTKAFEKHDDARFKQYLEKLKAGEEKAKVGAMLPHQALNIILSDQCQEDDAKKVLAEAQWKQMVDRMPSAAGAPVIAVCDVSDSMTLEIMPGLCCMDVAVALSLLISELDSPLRNKVISFASKPEMVDLPETTLAERARTIKAMKWSRTTDLTALFDMTFRIAKENKSAPAMRLFILSDMDFGRAIGRGDAELKTDFQRAKAKFASEDIPMPEIVFWNLQGGTGAPVLWNATGVALISGFSPTLLKQFLSKGHIDPITCLERTLQHKFLKEFCPITSDASSTSHILSCLHHTDHVELTVEPRKPTPQVLKSPEFSGVDVCFILDCTGSMGMEIEAAKKSILDITNVIGTEVKRKTGQDPNMRMACVAYRDYCDGSDRLQGTGFVPGSEVQKVRAFLEKQSASGGGDCPEDVFGGINMGLNYAWQGSVRLMILVADAPCHGELYHTGGGDDHPRGDPAGLTHQGLVSRMDRMGVSFMVLQIGKGLERMTHIFERCSRFADGRMPIMNLNRGSSTDYAAEFEEKVASCVIQRLALLLQTSLVFHDPQQDAAYGAGKKKKPHLTVGSVDTDLEGKYSKGMLIGKKGEKIKSMISKLQNMAVTLSDEVEPWRPWEEPITNSKEPQPQPKKKKKKGRRTKPEETSSAKPKSQRCLRVWLDVGGVTPTVTLKSKLKSEHAKNIVDNLCEYVRLRVIDINAQTAKDLAAKRPSQPPKGVRGTEHEDQARKLDRCSARQKGKLRDEIRKAHLQSKKEHDKIHWSRQGGFKPGQRPHGGRHKIGENNHEEKCEEPGIDTENVQSVAELES